MSKIEKFILMVIALSIAMTSSACAQTCVGEYSQEELDTRYKEFFDLAVLRADNVDEDSANCRYLEVNEPTSKEVFDMFTFIENDKYILYECTHKEFTEVVASPKYLVSHMKKSDGVCEPVFNPLMLRSYAMEFSKRDNELVKLNRLVE